MDDSQQDLNSAPVPVATSTPLEMKQGGKESEKRRRARTILKVTLKVKAEKTRIVLPLKKILQSSHKVKTRSTPIKDPVIAVTPLLVETLNTLRAKTKSAQVLKQS